MPLYENYKPTITNYSSFDEVPIEEREKTLKISFESFKEKRNQLLQETDKYVLIDYPITTEKLAIIKEYRQALRDFTNNNYIMPEKPVFL